MRAHCETHLTKDRMKMNQTHDLYLASFLRAIGFPLTGTRREGNRLIFQFGNSRSLQGEIDKYFNGTASVAPHAMAAAIRDLKSLVHQN